MCTVHPISLEQLPFFKCKLFTMTTVITLVRLSLTILYVRGKKKETLYHHWLDIWLPASHPSIAHVLIDKSIFGEHIPMAPTDTGPKHLPNQRVRTKATYIYTVLTWAEAIQTGSFSKQFQKYYKTTKIKL